MSLDTLNEPVVIVAARARSSWSSGCLHWPWLSASLVPLSLFLGRSLSYIDFVLKRSAWIGFFRVILLFFSFPRRVRRVEVFVCANCHVGQGANVSERVWMSMRAWREIFLFVYTLPVYVRVCLSSRLSWRLFWNIRRYWRSFKSIRQSASFSLLLLSDLLSSLYWPWDPLSSLESTPVSIQVSKQTDCNMYRFSKLLVFSFFFCKDGSDRLMEWAS